MKILMIYAMVCSILFPANDRRGELELRHVNRVEISSGWELLTDTAEITLPRNRQELKSDELKALIKRGDSISIRLGYDETLNDEFSGYVTGVDAGAPVKIRCEDEMWKLKQQAVNVSYKHTRLPDLISAIAPGYESDVMDIALGQVRFEKTTVAKVLQKLKDDYSLYSYFQRGKLVVGKVYSDGGSEVEYGFESNIISDSLEYRHADELKLKVTATSVDTKGNKLEVTVGDDDGEESRLSYYNIKDEATLKQLAEGDLARLKVDGYAGDFTGFGVPVTRHGDIVKLVSNEYPERAGRYYVDAVGVSFGTSGFRRKVTLGPGV